LKEALDPIHDLKSHNLLNYVTAADYGKTIIWMAMHCGYELNDNARLLSAKVIFIHSWSSDFASSTLLFRGGGEVGTGSDPPAAPEALRQLSYTRMIS
jgi:hypothetical protein